MAAVAPDARNAVAGRDNLANKVVQKSSFGLHAALADMVSKASHVMADCALHHTLGSPYTMEGPTCPWKENEPRPWRVYFRHLCATLGLVS